MRILFLTYILFSLSVFINPNLKDIDGSNHKNYQSKQHSSFFTILRNNTSPFLFRASPRNQLELAENQFLKLLANLKFEQIDLFPNKTRSSFLIYESLNCPKRHTHRHSGLSPPSKKS